MPQFSDDLFLGSAPAFIGTANTSTECVVYGSTSGTVMTVTQMLSGDPITVGAYVGASGITAGTYITSFGTGAGGVGTYNISASQSVGAGNLFISGNSGLGDPSPMDLGVGPVGRSYVFDVIPQTLQAANIAASQTPAAAGALTLTAGTSAKSVVRSDGSTVIQLDCPRAVSVTLVTGGTARAYTVSGYDYYGQAMTEVITSVAAATTAGKKAFYQISSIVGAAGGSTTALTFGTTDVIGLPIRVVDAGYVLHVGYGNALARNAGTFVAADTTTATSSTGDVRGTYTPATATNGYSRLVMNIGLTGIQAGPNATRIGALGVNQA
jgi:hypothetical protein